MDRVQAALWWPLLFVLAGGPDQAVEAVGAVTVASHFDQVIGTIVIETGYAFAARVSQESIKILG